MAIWGQVAYLARYGRQPLGEILNMTATDAARMQRALSSIVEQENNTK